MDENRPSYSIAVPVFVLEDREISPTAKLLYGVIDSFLRKSGACYASNARLANEVAGCSDRTISRCVAELKNAGYIKVAFLPKQKDKHSIRLITLSMSISDGHSVDKNGDTPSPILSTPHDNIGEGVIQEVIEKENKKRKTEQMSLKEMRPLFVAWLKSVAQPDWSRDVKNELFSLLNAFYDPDRVIKNGRLPPVRSKSGFTSMGNLLSKWSEGDPDAMKELLNLAIGNGWAGIKPLENRRVLTNMSVQEERQYECV